MNRNFPLIAGVDEAGRGCLAGPVVAGAVILPPEFPGEMLGDSKKMTEKQREKSYEWIVNHAYCGIGFASAEEIDNLGIRPATYLAMKRAIKKLQKTPDFLRIDGRDHFRFDIPSQEIIRGDSQFPEISAASIIAKVSRDRYMKTISERYAPFGFHRHKGYGVAKHVRAIREHGHTPLHRKSFNPLRKWLSQETLFQ
ncbi:ribonuclease HII [Candidatus Peregrinibacteria bacterium]|nr:MAG: ribonuclease HII [Candidatus Peregrinibacteria bacterium]